MPRRCALNRDLNEKLSVGKIVKNGKILRPYGETRLNKSKPEDLHVGRRELADLGFSQAKQSVMQIFLNEQNQRQKQQKYFKVVYCIAVTTLILEKSKAWKQLLRAVLEINCSSYLGKILEKYLWRIFF